MMNEFMAKAITEAVKAEIKEHIENAYSEENFNFWNKFKGIKLVDIRRADDNGLEREKRFHSNALCETSFNAHDGSKNINIMKLAAKFSYKAKKYEDNVLFYEVAIYSDGSMGLYFDGASYEG